MEERGYAVLRALGQGGQGRVYEVRNGQGTVCVLKQLPLVGDGVQERAMQEVRLLSSLRHPCIVPYLDSFTVRSMPSIPQDDVLCLVMQRCERDLRQECCSRRAQNARLEERQVLNWLTQLCWGLQHLHARRFLHRDLKPQNVLLTNAEGAIVERVLLADFGMAGRLDHTEDFKRSIVGTPAFMSPEMLEGRPYGCKTDQWALGCVLWEMMALQAPFAACESYAAIVVAVLQSEPMQAPDGYSYDLSGALEALLARRPDDRPTSAELLSGSLLRPTFQALLRVFAEGVQERSPAVVARSGSQPLTPASGADNVSYGSDFESYSGSETASNSGELPEQQLAEQPGSVSVDGWSRVFAEAEALLEPVLEADVPARIGKLNSVLYNALGSQDQVDKGISFLRHRKPLGDTAEADEMVLQIEIVDVLGEEGLHALPLLERYVALERQAY